MMPDDYLITSIGSANTRKPAVAAAAWTLVGDERYVFDDMMP